jgi:hypothetical protein
MRFMWANRISSASKATLEEAITELPLDRGAEECLPDTEYSLGPDEGWAGSIDAVERGHDISYAVDPDHSSGARYERAAQYRSRRRAF